MAEVPIMTDREVEAVYEYSDKKAINLAKTHPGQNVEVTLFFNRGNRILVIKDGNKKINEKYDLEDPKKPDDTGGVLLRFLMQEYKVTRDEAQKVLEAMPEIIEKVK